MKLFLTFLSTLTIVFSVNAQSTYQKVYSILQNNCSSCHGGANPQSGLDFSDTESNVYGAIYGQLPQNSYASSKGYELINPGFPERSFIMRKINQQMFSHIIPDSLEGGDMPVYGTTLPERDRDLIYSWINQGASLTGNIYGESVLEAYYDTGGFSLTYPVIPPDPSEGIQVYFGPIFLEPYGEIETRKKVQVDIDYDSEIHKIEGFLDSYSHHFIMDKYNGASDAAQEPDVVRIVDGLADLAINGTKQVATWQNSGEYELPEGTGYFWESNPYIDLNYHVKNYNGDSILRTEVYANIYFRPRQNNTVEMHTALVTFPEVPLPYPYSSFLIPADNQDYTFEGLYNNSGNPDSSYVWLLSTHTHKYGAAYDIFLRNDDGTRGSKVYDGFYDADYVNYLGYYDSEHPPVRYFNDFLPIKASNGLIHEATFNNYGSSDVTWGLTTEDEMMLILVQYINQRPSSDPLSTGLIAQKETLKVFPNPSSAMLNISSNERIDYVSLYDILGNQVLLKQSSNSNVRIDVSGLAAGVYQVHVKQAEAEYVKKVVVK